MIARATSLLPLPPRPWRADRADPLTTVIAATPWSPARARSEFLGRLRALWGR